MGKVLFINLTRFGDLLQSQAAIADTLRKGHTAGLVCLENFVSTLPLLQGLSHVAPLPGAAFLASLGETPPQVPGWAKGLSTLLQWRENLLAQYQPTEICNLTPTLAARLLARFIAGAGTVSGFGVDTHGFGQCSNPWTAFLLGASAARGLSPFNIVDVFRHIPLGHCPAGPGQAQLCQPQEQALYAITQKLAATAPPDCAGYIAIQLGASEEKRRWPVDSFVSLGHALWEQTRLCPVLLGSTAELPLAQKYGETAAHPFISLCGETSLPELAATLCVCKLLVTNDTGTMHLAAGLGTPILAFFLATAQPFDTGPYSVNACCLEPALPCHPCSFKDNCPHNLVCRQTILPQTATELALGFVQNGHWPTPLDTNVRAWVTGFDQQGFMHLTSLSGHNTADRSLWLNMQRNFLRHFLDRDTTRPFTCPASPQPLRFSQQGATALQQSLEQAYSFSNLLQQQGEMLLSHPVQPLRERFLQTWGKVHSLLQKSPYLHSLAHLWLTETQTEGKDLPAVLTCIRQFTGLMQAMLLAITK